MKDKSIYSYFVLIIGFTVISNVIVIATPAFFNHDELQKIDFLQQFGFSKYVEVFFKIFKTDRFEVPVRPIGYLIWGLTLLPMPEYPFLVHFFDVLIHGIVAFFAFILLFKLTGFHRESFMASLFFIVSPLATLAVGWSGAIFDRLYMLFLLTTAYFFIRYLESSNRLLTWLNALLMTLTSILAVFSKETALILPAFIFLIMLGYRTYGRSFDIKRAVGGIILVSLSVVTYLFLRIDSILNSFLTSDGGGQYSINVINIPINAVVYFVFPFLIPLTETINYIFCSHAALIIAGIIHVLVVVTIYTKWGSKAVYFYFAFYYIFLFPIIFIKSSNSHYLYGSGLVLSTAMAFLIIKGQKILKIMVTILFIVLLLHTGIIQKKIYEIGLCQAKLLSSMESISKSMKEGNFKAGIRIIAEPGSPKYILQRTTCGRNKIGNISGVIFEIADDDKMPEDKKVTLHFDDSCHVYVRK